MLRQDPDRISPDRRRAALPNGGASNRSPQRDTTRIGGVDIQRELNKLEEMILDSPRIPLSRRTVVDEEQLLDQLDLVRLNLPTAFQEATEILLHKEEVILEAEQIAQQIIATAEQRAAQILDEMDIVRMAEREAQQIRQQVQQDCELMQQQVMADIDQMRRRAQQELEDMQRSMIAECEDIQRGADDYADRVLSDLEAQFTEMMRVIRNGRQQIQSDSAAKQAEMNSFSRRLQDRLR
ncbi:MAG: hypothetical protein EDM05_042380 [Leptolyngbya sp. IPPAS B-1204]|uniref:DivIVA domain-containing protein n=1 Tax=Leptolyngbya sp. NK1-12 TaxID=2547451 RepID=A0AA96WFK5_9CYAN|nr:hypothetical protein [Leptolyngbya sp. NK1-12]MBF2048204.1 DivIVA domain-containing protein [Elainella sp. C42_A2020_010]RNJ68275.1 MAG: DivIVA domain-containing protein [Leptolyngbya sp. IPPAS B-1204]WNZ24175.1 DivIVA domain-containing protein [Leptolyngbya sp. NK1-12]